MRGPQREITESISASVTAGFGRAGGNDEDDDVAGDVGEKDEDKGAGLFEEPTTGAGDPPSLAAAEPDDPPTLDRRTEEERLRTTGSS